MEILLIILVIAEILLLLIEVLAQEITILVALE